MNSIKIIHTTYYKYDYSPLWVIHKVIITPPSTSYQNVVEWDLKVEGGDIQLTSEDHFGNIINLVKSKNKTIKIIAKGIVNIIGRSDVSDNKKNKLPLECYLNQTYFTKPGGNIKKIIKKFSNFHGTPVELFSHISQYIRDKIIYKKNITKSDTSAEQACSLGYGVCQDHSHIFISIAREMGYPARYISGYLKLNKIKRQEASHAWSEVFFNNIGWVGYDVSNGISPDSNYILIAKGFDFNDVVPVKGVKIGISKEVMKTNIIIDNNQ